MDQFSDTYRTLRLPSGEVLFKDKKSKFFGYAFPLSGEEQVNVFLKKIRVKHPGANHFCYAWQLGPEKKLFRANDDGEPNNTAGMPIYRQIQSYGLTNVLVVVARIFGGVKLGAAGLINAYRSAARLALEASEIVEKVQQVPLRLNFEYPQMNSVMRIVKSEQLQIVSLEQELSCRLTFLARKGEVDKVLSIFQNLQNVDVEILE